MFTNLTNLTHKKGVSKGKDSLHVLLQKLEAQEEIRLEKLLRNVQLQEDFLQDLPSLEDTLAEVDQLIEQMKKELEEYLNE